MCVCERERERERERWPGRGSLNSELDARERDTRPSCRWDELETGRRGRGPARESESAGPAETSNQSDRQCPALVPQDSGTSSHRKALKDDSIFQSQTRRLRTRPQNALPAGVDRAARAVCIIRTGNSDLF